jgi:brefeldin A-inhibited guanine nucleotide-exchange protein
MNIISKIVTTPQHRTHDHSIPPPPVPFMKANNPSVLPSLSTSALAVSGNMDTSVIGLSDTHLKRQALECLVTVLRSLVAWGTTAAKSAVDSAGDPARTSQADDLRQANTIPDVSHDKLLSSATTSDVLRQSSPDIADDPTKFESAKQKKTTLLEGIKKFNFKPKRVRRAFMMIFFLSLILYSRVSNSFSKLDSFHPRLLLILLRFCFQPMGSARW